MVLVLVQQRFVVTYHRVKNRIHAAQVEKLGCLVIPRGGLGLQVRHHALGGEFEGSIQWFVGNMDFTLQDVCNVSQRLVLVEQSLGFHRRLQGGEIAREQIRLCPFGGIEGD